jgi:hypothetical protein
MINKTYVPSTSKLTGLFSVKSFKSPFSGTQVSTVLYRVDANNIALYDPFGYLLDTYSLSEPITYVATPSAGEELVLAVLTESDYLYLLPLHYVDPNPPT